MMSRIIAGLGIALGVLGINALAGTQHIEERPPRPEPVTIDQATAEAEAAVASDLAAATESENCWGPDEQDASRWPTHAYIKGVGQVEVVRASATHAADRARSGDAWILAWCDDEATSTSNQQEQR